MKIRLMRGDDVDFALYCTQVENWVSSSPEVFRSYLEYDPAGCFIAEVNDQAAGICIATRYQNTGFIGELIVILSMRGQGIGSALFKHALNYLSNYHIRVVYLDGDLPAVPLYEKYGFNKNCLSLRFIGKPVARSNSNVRPAVSEDIKSIVALDRRAFGDDRSFFLKRLFTLYPHYCLVSEHNNTITGYIMARPGQNIITVGPCVIIDRSINPELLISGLAAYTGDHILRIGVLEINQPAVSYFRNNNVFQEQTPCWRMSWGLKNQTGVVEMLCANGSGAKG